MCIRQMRMADVKGGILKSFASVQDKVCSMCRCSREKPYHLIGVSKRWGQQKIKATFQIEKEMKPWDFKWPFDVTFANSLDLHHGPFRCHSFAALPVFVVASLGGPTAWFWIGARDDETSQSCSTRLLMTSKYGLYNQAGFLYAHFSFLLSCF